MTVPQILHPTAEVICSQGRGGPERIKAVPAKATRKPHLALGSFPAFLLLPESVLVHTGLWLKIMPGRGMGWFCLL